MTESATCPGVPTPREAQPSYLTPQLPSPSTPAQHQVLLDSDDWCLQEQLAGDSRTLVVEGRTLRGEDRQGLRVSLPSEWAGLPVSDGRTVFCGLQLAGTFLAFDLLAFMGRDLRAEGYGDRLYRLEQLLRNAPDWLQVLPTAFGSSHKRSHAWFIEARGGAGCVFKHLLAPFEVGPGQASVKHRFEGAAAGAPLRLRPPRGC